MNKTIYIFWLGDENKKQELLTYYNQVNKLIAPWKIELGPTKEEHDYLIKKSHFYKKAFNKKIYSFCSDIYRCYKIYNNGGFYLDSGFKINLSRIKEFLNKLEETETLFVYEQPSYFLSGLFYIKDKNNKLCKKAFNYLNRNSYLNIYFVPTMPLVISKYIYQQYGYYPENHKNIICMKSYELDPKNENNYFYLNSTGSWQKNKSIDHQTKINDLWQKLFNSFNQEINPKTLLKTKKKLTNLPYRYFRQVCAFFIYKIPILEKIYNKIKKS